MFGVLQLTEVPGPVPYRQAAIAPFEDLVQAMTVAPSQIKAVKWPTTAPPLPV
jgi:hypothetical protein